MQTFKRIALFLAVNALLCLCLSFALTDPSVVDIYLDDIRENQYDTLILGTSHGETGFDPFLMSEGLDAKVFNASRRLMSVTDIYYLLRAANQDGQIRTVYYELDPVYWNAVPYTPTHEDVCMLRHAPLLDRIDYMLRYLWDKNYNYTLFPYDLNAQAIRKAPAVIKNKLSLRGLPHDDQIRTLYRNMNISPNYDYMGRGFRYGTAPEEEPIRSQLYPLHFVEEKIDPEYLDMFDRMVRYCREKDIRLVCVISALPRQRLRQENHADAYIYFSELCESYGVTFYDMNYAKPGLLDREFDEYTDIDGHMMGPLAQRQTQLLVNAELAQDKDAFFDVPLYVYESYGEEK